MSNPNKEFHNLDQAFGFFNRHLFDGELPPCLITLNYSKRKFLGFCWKENFESRGDDGEPERVTEIALNPATFHGRDDKDILSTLVHEMVHHWQFCHGSPGKKGYHNKEWANKMEEIGLVASNTGAPGGKKTGQKMTHYIVGGGEFCRYADRYLEEHDGLRYQIRVPGQEEEKKAKAKNKHRYECGECGAKIWAKPGLNVQCGDCEVPFVDQDDDAPSPPPKSRGNGADVDQDIPL